MNNTIITDLHVHSIHSSDAKNSIEENCLSALSKGITILGITDHIDIDYPGEGVFSKLNKDVYISDINECKKKYVHDLTVLTGLEIGLQPHLKEITGKISKDFDVDYIIGSTHCVMGEEISANGLFKKRGMIESYNRYFEAIIENISTIDNFDILGHLDFIERYYPSDDKILKYENHRELIDLILQILIDKKKALEINTSGYRYKLDKPHPSFEVIKKYKELGGEFICIGSDAHCANHIGADFDKAKNMLLQAGFTKYHYFVKRQPITLEI